MLVAAAMLAKKDQLCKCLHLCLDAVTNRRKILIVGEKYPEIISSYADVEIREFKGSSVASLDDI